MTHVFAILDRSGSMGGLETDTIGGYNSFIDKLRKQKGIKVTLTLFDNEYEQPYTDLAIKDVPKLDNKIYFARGSTALIDAFCRSINTGKTIVKKADKAIVLVITDGYENSSSESTTADMKKLVTDLGAKKNWTFTYLGANQDAWANAQNWGFDKGNVSNYNPTRKGTAQVFTTMSVNTGAFAASGNTSTKSFYSDQDKVKLES